MPNWRAVAEQPEERSASCGRGDHQDVADPRQHQRGQRVVDHRLVVDRHQLLADAQRDRVEPGARATGQDDAAHGRHPRTPGSATAAVCHPDPAAGTHLDCPAWIAFSSPAAPASSAPTSCTTSSTHTDASRHRARQADLRRQRGVARPGCPTTGSTLVVGDIADAAMVEPLVAEHDAVVHFAAESHNDNSLDDPRAVHPDQPASAPSRSSRRPAAHDARLHHISTDEVYGDLDARRPEALHRGHAVQPEQPLLRLQGRLGPPGARLGAQLRRARHDLELLQQLRPVAARREVHPAPDHQRHRRRPPEGLRRRPATCATGSTPTTTPPPCWRSSSAAGSARPT